MNKLQQYSNSKLLEMLAAPQGTIIRIGKDVYVQKLAPPALEDMWQPYHDE